MAPASEGRDVTILTPALQAGVPFYTAAAVFKIPDRQVAIGDTVLRQRPLTCDLVAKKRKKEKQILKQLRFLCKRRQGIRREHSFFCSSASVRSRTKHDRKTHTCYVHATCDSAVLCSRCFPNVRPKDWEQNDNMIHSSSIGLGCFVEKEGGRNQSGKFPFRFGSIECETEIMRDSHAPVMCMRGATALCFRQLSPSAFHVWWRELQIEDTKIMARFFRKRRRADQRH